jgi:hypothetical protein
LEAGAAEHWPALRRFEGYGSLGAALRANRTRFRSHAAAGSGCTFDLALLAALGIVFELFVVEKKLLARGENEVVSAVDTLEDLIDELHDGFPPETPRNLQTAADETLDRLKSPISVCSAFQQQARALKRSVGERENQSCEQGSKAVSN